MLIFLLVIIGLSVLILGHEAGHFVAAKLFGLKVDEFGFGFPPRIFKKRRGETDYSFNWLPFGGFVRIAGESDRISGEAEKLEALPAEEKKRYFFFQPVWRKAVVVVAGVAVNFVLGWFILSAVLMVGAPRALVISDIQRGSPAEAAGFIKNDIILGFEEAENFIIFVDDNRGKEIILEIVRGGEKLSIAATPRTETGPQEGALGVGFFEGGGEKMGFFTAIWEGFVRSLRICGAVVVALISLVKNLLFNASLLEGVVGPIGVFSVAYGASGLGITHLLQLIAMISLNLAVINLIPFPALDGGRLFLIFAEKIKGSPVPYKIESWVNGIGFALLIFLMAILSARDIGNLI